MNIRKFAGLLFCIALLARLASASVLITNQIGQSPLWATMPIAYWISAAGSSQVLNGSEFQAVQAAFQAWQNVPYATVSFKYMGTTPVSTVGHDGLNVVTF